MIEEEKVHLDDVVDGNEIPTLLAVAVPVAASEQPYAASLPVLVKAVQRHRGHPALVLLAGPVDIEVSQAHCLRVAGRVRPSHQIVEEQLGVAVDVQRSLALPRLAKLLTAAVDGRRGSVQQACPALAAVLEEQLGIRIVVVHHVAAIRLRRGRTGALMENRVDGAERCVALEQLPESLLVDVVGNVALDDIAELVGPRHVVDDNDVVDAAAIESRDEVRADEAGAAGDDDHGVDGTVSSCDSSSARVATAVPSLPTTMPAAALASSRACSCGSRAASAVAITAITVSPAPLTS